MSIWIVFVVMTSTIFLVYFASKRISIKFDNINNLNIKIMFIPNKLTTFGIINGTVFKLQNGDHKEVTVSAIVQMNPKTCKTCVISTTISTEDWIKACEDFIFSDNYKRYSAD